MCYQLIRWPFLFLFALSLATVAHAQLNENCTVSILNRTAQVKQDGTWIAINVPANFGQVRARATCVENGVTRSGQTDLFTVPANGSVTLSEIPLGAADPIPESLTPNAPTSTLTTVGTTTQLTVTAKFPDGSTKNVAASSTGTSYTNSNAKVATVSADGLVTAISSGTIIISALNEGTLGLIRLQVALAGGDTDGDGIPDDIERANGLDPNNPADGFADPDGDGLTNKQELVDFGTRIDLANTDGDGLSDGDEVQKYKTNPLLRDTDGDGVSDGAEVAAGSDPTNPNSRPGLTSLTVSPSTLTLTVNTVLGEASPRLTVTGRRANGDTVDLTADPGTNYASSDLNICNFGAERGRVFAGGDGSCTITITNSGQSAQATITVHTFAPTALTFIDLPGTTNNVDVSGNFAYIAAGAAGLQVVDITNRSAPVITGALDTPGIANDVVVVGSTAYIADGSSGLQSIDVTDPHHPSLRGLFDTPGDAQDVVVKVNRAFIADGNSGLQVIDLSNPNAPVLLGSVATAGPALGVDATPDGQIAIVAEGSSGIQVVDVSDATHPVIIGVLAGGNVQDVALSGNFAFLADLARSFTSVDLSDPRHPVLQASTPRDTGGFLNDVAVAGRFAAGADIFFVNDVPVIDISTPGSPQPRALLPFRSFSDDNGTGVAMDSAFVYLTTDRSRLFIGQYLNVEDKAGIAPTVKITSPASGATVIGGDIIPVTVEANDDVAVSAVSVLVDGQSVATDTTEPYQLGVPVPVRTSSITLSAKAVDFGGNATVSENVPLIVIPDPGTTAQGRVTDQQGRPVSGGTVLCSAALSSASSSTLTGGDGVFSLSDLPAGRGNIRCRATFTGPNGQMLNGVAAEARPVAGGITPIGDISVSNATVVWIGPTKGDWNDPSNWNTSAVPGPNDRVVVSRPGSTFTITLASGDVTVKSVQLDGDFVLSTGSFTVTEASTVSGAFTMGDGTSLTVRGSGASFVANGATKIDNANFFAVNGGQLRLPGVTRVDVSGFYSMTFRAEGVGSKVELPALQTLNVGGQVYFQAISGGQMRAPLVSTTVRTTLQVEGAGSVLDLSALTTLGGGGYSNENLIARDGGTLIVPTLARIDTGRFHIEPGSLLLPVLQQLQALTTSFVTVPGANVTLPGLTTIDNTEFTVTGGGHLQLPGVVSVTVNGGYDVLLRAEGVGSVIELPALQTANVGGDLSFQAVAGGTVRVPGLSSASRAIILVDGAGSVLDVSALTTFGGYASDNLIVRNGGALVAPRLTSLDLAVFHVEPGSPLLSLLQQVQSLTIGRITVNGVDVTLPALTSIDNTEFTVTGGGHLRLPGVVSATANGGYGVLLRAEGTGSMIELPALQTANVGGSLSLQAVNGGQVRVPVLSNLTRSQIVADGTGSIVDLSGLTSVDTTSVSFSEQNGGKIIRPGGTSSSLNATSRAVTAAAIAPSNSTTLFHPELRVEASAHPSAISVADVNGDTINDLITTDTGANTVSVFLGQGSGTFQPARTFAVGDGPVALAIVDLNHDGMRDIVTANSKSHDISVLIGTGSGTFQSPQRFGVGINPSSIVSADVNRDGIPDIITANQGDGVPHHAADVSVLVGIGNGTFQREHRFAAGDQPLSVAIGDLNVDGVLDLVTANGASGDVSVLFGDGNGSFNPQRLVAAGTAPSAVVLADVNQDKKLDIIVTDASTNAVSILLNKGKGTFQPRQQFATGSAPAAVAVMDINGDGIADIITANTGSNDVSLLLGTGAASFKTQQQIAVGIEPRSLYLADLNSDGAIDLVTANSGSGDISVLLHYE